MDFLLAVGGGSVIDSAKAIGYGVTNEGDVWDFYDRRRQASARASRSSMVPSSGWTDRKSDTA